eukprot:2000049-Alexandrium_andersonii.AAC.1
MLWVAHCREGLEVDTFLQGLYPSTTRAELFGLLIALHLQGPLHVGTDSRNVVRGFKALSESLLAAREADALVPRFRWGLKRDGDAWAL